MLLRTFKNVIIFRPGHAYEFSIKPTFSGKIEIAYCSGNPSITIFERVNRYQIEGSDGRKDNWLLVKSLYLLYEDGNLLLHFRTRHRLILHSLIEFSIIDPNMDIALSELAHMLWPIGLR